MADDDDLRLNTLHRFSKHSSRLTLQEYSHCEVPAGCGGIVMRWTDPSRGPRAWIRIGTTGRADTWLDGELLASNRTPLTPGKHVLAFHLKNLGTMPTPVGIGLWPDQRWRADGENLFSRAYPLIERWAPGPQTGSPADPGFDDRAWAPPPHANDDQSFARQPADVQSFVARLRDQELTMLALGSGDGRLDEAWIRIRFTLAPGLLTERVAP